NMVAIVLHDAGQHTGFLIVAKTVRQGSIPPAMLKTRVSAAAMLAPAALAVSLVLLLPLILMFRYSLNRFEPGRFMVEALTLDNYAKLVSDAYYLGVLRSTVLMALAVTVACLALGFPLALAIARATPRVKAVLIVLVVVPLFV